MSIFLARQTARNLSSWNFVRLVYCLVYLLLWPFLAVYLTYQYVVNGKYKASYRLRLGLLDPLLAPTPKGKLCIWIHAVSLGETNAVAALIEKLLITYPDARIILSHITQTGYEQGVKLFGSRLEHLILPPDLPWKMRRLMKRACPNILIFVESDWWPNLCWYAKQYGARLGIVNARLSPKSWKTYKRLKSLSCGFWQQFDFVAAQSQTQLAHFLELGVGRLNSRVCGNMKLARAMEPDASKLERFRCFLPDGDIVVLSCTHAPEEKQLFELLGNLKTKRPIRWVVAPRHPERFDEIERLMLEFGLDVARWSQSPKPCQWLLLDAMGCLNEVYYLSSLALVAGSWCKNVGGHNFLEPVMVSVPTLYGPYVYKQHDFHLLAKQQGLAECVNLQDLSNSLRQWLEDEGKRQAWKESIKDFQVTSRKSVNATFDCVKNSIDGCF